MALQKLVLASGNAGKLREFNALLTPLQIEVLPQSAFNVPEADEPFATFIENALAKARHASQHTGLPALADDSGICVPALGGAPGVYSARYAALEDGQAKSDARNNARLVRELIKISTQQPTPTQSAHTNAAYYYCVLLLVRHPQDPQPLIADGLWHGEIIAEPRGAGGFGYDPHFWLPALQLTAAELPAEQKNKISHRGQAMQRLLALLSDT